MKNLIVMIWLTILTTNSYADGPDVVHLNPGDKAPMEGVLLSISKATDTKAKLVDRDQLDAINQSLTKSINLYKSNEDLYNSKISILMQQNDSLAKSAYDLQTTSFYKYVILFLGGCAATTLGLYGLKQITK